MRPNKIIKMLSDTRWLQQESELKKFIQVCEADTKGKLNDEVYTQGFYLLEARRAILNVNAKALKEKFGAGERLISAINEERIRAVKTVRKQFDMPRSGEIFAHRDDILNKFRERHPDKELIVLVIAGSHFFDLSLPESDIDFRGVYLEKEEVISKGQLKWLTNEDSKNGKDDVDVDLYSVNKMLKLIAKGDFNMLELLFVPRTKILVDSVLYKWLRSINTSFVTENISPFIGFIKKEYSRYGITGNHYEVQVKFLEFIKDWELNSRLKDHWEEIVEHSKDKSNLLKITKSRTGTNDMIDSLVLAHRMYQCNITVEYLTHEITQRLKRYGHRAKNRDDGADSKGLYHAQRLIYEAKDIVTTGKLSFPFSDKRMNRLREIKSGKACLEKLGETISEDIDFLREFEYEETSRIEYVQNLVDRISYNLSNEQNINNIIQGVKNES